MGCALAKPGGKSKNWRQKARTLRDHEIINIRQKPDKNSQSFMNYFSSENLSKSIVALVWDQI